MTATTANMVKGWSVTDVAIFAVNMISFSPMTEDQRGVLDEADHVVAERGKRDAPRLREPHEQEDLPRVQPDRLRGIDLSPLDAQKRAPEALAGVGTGDETEREEPAQKGGMSTNRVDGSMALAMAVSVTALPK